MFFSAELLSRRENGLGLLWLAATLGPKSSFKKLPRRSVLTADISQLCGLIAEPEEPLALRLSSNLMIGVVRVYKVKQEILLTDVTVCFNTLKKVVSEMHISTSVGDLQMGQPAVRPDTVTIAIDPTVALAMDFEHLFQAWEDRNQNAQDVDGGNDENGSDEEFDPTGRTRKRKTRTKASSISVVEEPRLDAHTLKENHDLLLSSSVQGPFHAGPLGDFVSSSPQFGFDDNFMDVDGEIGDELARELGEGWGGIPALQDQSASAHGNGGSVAEPNQQDAAFNFEEDLAGIDDNRPPSVDILGSVQNAAKTPASILDDGVFAPEGSIIIPLSPLDPSAGPNTQGTEGPRDESQRQLKKTKRVRLLLDARTELTNEELEKARANYMEGQALLRHEIEQRKAEKKTGQLLEEMIWGAPRGINAPALVDFWLENFRLQVEARSGHLHIETHGQPPRKRRRVDETGALEEGEEVHEVLPKEHGTASYMDFGMDLGIEMGSQFGTGNDGPIPADDFNVEESRLRSSEEPGQGRRASRSPSLPASHRAFGLGPVQEFNLSSQKSNVFPWDNAGVSSSISGALFQAGGSDRASISRAGHRKRGNSLNRSSPLPLGITDSPASFGLRSSQLELETAFEFELPDEEAAANESQRSDASLLTLEKNSFNFLEYAKMQLQAFPSAISCLKIDDIVPKESSTRHVAAAAFYHCLVLTTKDLLGVKQDVPYGDIVITVK